MENPNNPEPSNFAKSRLQEATRAKHSATVLALTLSTAAVGLVVLLCWR
jgi:hypothetical protein